MNKAITDGLDLMPPPFADGLADWSSSNGTPGSPDYAGAANAALVASDADFGTCLELQKTQSVQRLRYKGEVPVLPGCYLRIAVRVKAMSGPLPIVRIAGWAGAAGGAHVSGVTETGPQVTLGEYGQVTEISAYVGTGLRQGVDMVWGGTAVYGHFGIDVLGTDGAVLRIESVRIEDMTQSFHRVMMDWVDVRDFGAKGDGATDDTAAFLAADAAALGRQVLVPKGIYRLLGDVTMTAPCRFEGTLSMPAARILALTGNYGYAAYLAAFGDETLALKKALQALFNFSDHDSLDLGGRRIELSEPIDVQAAVGNVSSFGNRRVIRNGQIAATNVAAFDSVVYTATARRLPGDELTLHEVANVAAIPLGALVTGTGLGREIYVAAKNTGAQTLTLSHAPFGAAAVQSYTFTRFRYLLDFSGFDQVQRFQIADIEFLCGGHASGLMLPRDGIAWHVRDCWFTRPRDRAITSIGSGCAGMAIDACEFVSNEYDTAVADRRSVAFNTNSNDVKLRNNRAVRFRHFGVMAGGGNVISGNHFWQGDDTGSGERNAGLILAGAHVKSVVVGNYVDNCWIELNNEYSAGSVSVFGGLSVSGNIFTANDVPPWFAWLSLAPYGANQLIDGIAVLGNVFKVLGGDPVDRAEVLDLSRGSVDKSATRDLVFAGNAFKGVNLHTASPLLVEHVQAGVSAGWLAATGGRLPFGARALGAEAASATGPISDAAGANVFVQPWLQAGQGAQFNQVQINWPAPVKGRMSLRVRADLAG